jgi:hypothetical protein
MDREGAPYINKTGVYGGTMWGSWGETNLVETIRKGLGALGRHEGERRGGRRRMALRGLYPGSTMHGGTPERRGGSRRR